MAGLGSQSPNQREGLSAISSITGNNEYVYSTNHALDVSITSSVGELAINLTEINGNPVQTAASGIMKIGLTDGTGNAITSTGGALDVNATFSGTVSSSPTFSQNPAAGTPTPAYGLVDSSFRPQVSIATALPAGSSVIGHVITDTGSTTAVTGTVTVSGTVTANAGTNLNTSALALAATQTDKSQFTKLTDGTDTALITAAGEQNVIATAQPGVDIGDVTINNAGGAAAVNIQDGGNTITVDGTVSITANSSVNLAQVAGTTTATDNGASSAGTQRVTIANNSTGVVGLNAGSNTVGSIASITTSVTPGTAAANLGKAEDAGHTTGDVGVMGLLVRTDAQAALATTTADYIPAITDSIGAQYITPSASTGSIGASIYNNNALSSTKQAVNASAGNLYGYHIYNPNASVVYVQVWNVASASVTVGTTAPTMVLVIPALGWADAPPSLPIDFKTALTIAATTTATGSTAPGTAIICNIWYK